MNTRISALAALTSALLLGQLGCTSIVGERYYEGVEFTEAGHASHAADVGVHPPHSRFHPVPTRPVFSARPNTTLTIAERSAPPAPTASMQPASAAGNAVAAPATHTEVRPASVEAAVSPQPKAPAPKQAPTSSRRVASTEEIADVAEANETANAPKTTTEPSPTPSNAWTDRFGSSDGWRPRAR